MIKVTFLCLYAIFLFVCLHINSCKVTDQFQSNLHIFDKKIENFKSSWMIVKLQLIAYYSVFFNPWSQIISEL